MSWKHMGGAALALLLGASVGGCGDDGDAGPDDAGMGGDAAPAPFEPDAVCPGPDCPDEDGVGMLEVGAGLAAITAIDGDGNYVATGQPPEVLTSDVDGDLKYDPGDGDTFDDVNGNGVYDGVWIAGYTNGLGATGANDDQWVRAIALRHEGTTMVVASIDCIGYFKNEMDRIRASVADLGIDHVFIASTHTHEAHDTMGLWGPTETTSGLYPGYMDFIVQQADAAIRDAVAGLEQSTIQYASFRLRDIQDMPPAGSPQGVQRFVADNRDPNIIDDEVRMLHFARTSDGSSIATLINWGSHPEYGGSHNPLLSSDYAHWLRDGVENGVTGPDGEVAGLGGMAVFFPGALGGQIGANQPRSHIWWDGTEYADDTFPGAPETLGKQLAYYVLEALAGNLGYATVVEEETAPIGFRTKEFYVHLQNRAFFVAFNFGIFDRELHEWDPELPVTEDNEPAVLTEATVIDIGRAQLISTPGELHPELFIGGYDGAHTPDGQPIIDPDNPNPPDLDAAPGPPYLRDLARSDAEFVFLMGLGNDTLGYIVPPYNYVLHESAPYFEEAEGDHYEETNSAGDEAMEVMLGTIEQLLAWTPEG